MQASGKQIGAGCRPALCIPVTRSQLLQWQHARVLTTHTVHNLAAVRLTLVDGQLKASMHPAELAGAIEAPGMNKIALA